MAIPIAVLQIPFKGTGPWFAQPITLNGVSYVLEFQYNERLDLWFLDILDQAETPIVQGIALTAARDLLQPYRAKVFAGCNLFVYDSTGKQSNPGYDSFSTTHKLLFTGPS